MEDERLYKIALALLPHTGPVNTKKIIAHFGSVEAVFKTGKEGLLRKNIPHKTVEAICDRDLLEKAEKEMAFIDKHGIAVHFYLDSNYPSRLKHCEDGPILLYSKGNMQFETPRAISIVGTRTATSYGREFCDRFISDLSSFPILVVSGLAYGIDIQAHRACIRHGIQTIGVLAHGMERIYPPVHRETALKMMDNGGLLTDFRSNTPFHPGNFPSRNRIVAGLTDATLVIESAEKGGSLITAEIAGSYNREVFAVPGKINDNFSRGCNVLIKKNKAALIESVEDLIDYMGWENYKKVEGKQKKLFENLSEKEVKMIALLREKSPVSIDELCLKTGLPGSAAAEILLDLEFKGYVKSMPGSRYDLY